MTKSKFDVQELVLIEDASQALMALEEGHFRIFQEKKIEDEKSIAAWSDFLRVLDNYDQIRDTAVQKLRRGSWRNFGRSIMIWGSVSTVAAYIFLLIFDVKVPDWVLYLGIGISILAGLIYRYSSRGKMFASLNRKLKKLEKIDFPNILRNYLMPLVDFLKEECRSDTSLKIFFNLSNRTFKPGQDTLRHNYKTRSGYTLQSTSFSDYDLLTVTTKLYDGSILVYQLSDQIRQRYFSRSKFTASGKYKTKSKYKYKTKITHSLRLAVPKKLYRLNNTILPEQSEGILIEQFEDDKRYIFKLKGYKFSKSNLSSTYQPDLHEMLRLMSEVYKRLDKVEQIP